MKIPGHRILLATALALVAAAASFPGCGPSAEDLCHQLNDTTCPDGSKPYKDETFDICVQDFHSTNCSDTYRALVDCEINTPECDGKYGCSKERDKDLGCAYNEGANLLA